MIFAFLFGLFAFQNACSALNIGEMRGAQFGGSSHGDNPRLRIKGDTAWRSNNETYVLFIGTLLEKKFPNRVYRSFKIKSVIRGDFDTANYLPIITAFDYPMSPLEYRCTNIKFETNKDYLILNVIEYQKGRRSVPNRDTVGSSSRFTKCENILPDTPENREKLIEKYEKTIIIKEPKPDGVKK